MQLRELPRGGQLSIKGNIVNVPADVNNTVRVLPRNMDDSETIPLKFKRSLNFKGYISFERIRPEKILLAAKWLVTNSSLFQNEGIIFDDHWSATPAQESFPDPLDTNSNGQYAQSSREFKEKSTTEDEWTENDEMHHHRPSNIVRVLLDKIFAGCQETS